MRLAALVLALAAACTSGPPVYPGAPDPSELAPGDYKCCALAATDLAQFDAECADVLGRCIEYDCQLKSGGSDFYPTIDCPHSPPKPQGSDR